MKVKCRPPLFKAAGGGQSISCIPYLQSGRSKHDRIKRNVFATIACILYSMLEYLLRKPLRGRERERPSLQPTAWMEGEIFVATNYMNGSRKNIRRNSLNEPKKEMFAAPTVWTGEIKLRRSFPCQAVGGRNRFSSSVKREEVSFRRSLPYRAVGVTELLSILRQAGTTLTVIFVTTPSIRRISTGKEPSVLTASLS